MCARPISSSRALLRVRTCEPTHRKRLAAGVLTIMRAIDRYRVTHLRSLLKLGYRIGPNAQMHHMYSTANDPGDVRRLDT